MPTIKLKFPGGRYHATPWGHHVNEGLIEWPPSPWRLLRAFVACGYSSQHWSEVPPLAQQLIYKLASVLPSYELPEASAAHSRHFMPVGVLAKGREQTTLVFDTWANVGDGELVIHWPCEFEEAETKLFERLVSALGYLGRSESWVVAEMVSNHSTHSNSFNAFPHVEGEYPRPGFEQLSLMAAIPAEKYQSWREPIVKTALAEFPLPSGSKKPPAKLLKDRERVIAPYPANLLDGLMKDTAWWKQHGWSQPPGSQRVLYWRQSNVLQVSPPRRSRQQPSSTVTSMLLSLTTQSGNKSALPSINRTLPQAELFHRAVISRLGKGEPVECPELTGKDELNHPLQNHHAHAHTLPLDLDGDGRLDHILIHAKMGLSLLAQRAIRRLRRTFTKGLADAIQVAVVAAGDCDLLRELPAELGASLERLLGPPTGSREWISVTPFLLPRYLKPHGKNCFLEQINAELASRKLPEVERFEIDAELTKELRHMIRRRHRGGTLPPQDMGYGLRILLKSAITGPLSLGYASHFGLGLFRSVRD